MADEVDLVKRLRIISGYVDGAHFCGDDSILRNDLDLPEVSDILQKAADEITRLRASIAIKDKALEKLEWSGSRGCEECSWCGEYKTDGHAPNCLISQALHTAER